MASNISSTDGEAGAGANESVEQTAEPTHVVGIGASAGGLAALTAFFRKQPVETPLAFVVIQHLSPDRKSLMPELLTRHTSLSVQLAKEGVAPQAGNVYLIPHNQEMTLREGRLHLEDRQSSRFHHLPIDTFFLSLAEDRRDRAVGVILSGAGSDGMRGIRAIKDAGGVVLVQDPEQAEFSGMPGNALSTGLVDAALPVEKLPETLGNLTRRDRSDAETAQYVQQSGNYESNLQSIITLIREQTGMDFAQYKQPTILRRLQRRMDVNHVATLQKYVDLLDSSPHEVHALRNEMLIGVTRFFRDPEAFEVLREDVLPHLLQPDSKEPVRVWVAGCYTGEEAYSLAMLMEEYRQHHGIGVDFTLFATDVDQSAIEFAREGLYPASILGDVSAERIERFFTRNKDHFRVVAELRRKVTFAPHNVIKDPPFRNLDLVSCRNLLIYIEPEAQRRVLAMIGHVLKIGGVLFLGPSETPGEMSRQFTTLHQRWKLFRKNHHEEGSLGELLQTLSEDRPSVLPQQTTPRKAEGESGSLVGSALLRETLQEVLLAQDAGCLVLDENFRIVQSFGHISQYVHFRPGEASLDIRQLAAGDLATALSSALLQARSKDHEIRLKGLHLRDAELWVDLRIRRLRADRQNGKLFLLLLEHPRTGKDLRQQEGSARETELLQRIHDLENQLDLARESLRTSMGEAQVTREEMQTTNEELMTSNEELQSTNEELQSVNEELHTVNAELQSKIRELNQLNDDMNNLFQATDVGTIFIDRNLQIRRFTPKATELMNLLPQDVGRPIDNITGELTHVPLVDLARSVVTTGTATEWESLEVNERDYMLRFVPYRTDEGDLQGVVITFVDIASVRRAERLQSLIDALPTALFLVNPLGCILQTNRHSKQTREEHIGGFFARLNQGDNLLHALQQQAEICPHLRRVAGNLKALLDGKREQADCEIACRSGGCDPHAEVERWLYVSMRTFQADHPAAVVAVSDITQIKTGQQALARLAQIVQDSEDAIVSKTLDGTITSWNDAAETIYGYTAQEALGQNIRILSPDNRQNDIPHILDQLRKGKGVSHYKTLRKRKDGELIYVSITVSPLRDPDGNITGASSIARPLETKR